MKSKMHIGWLMVLAVAAGFVFIALPPIRVHAADASTCAITQANLDAIQAIQNDPTLNYSAELSAELAARKNLLNQVITCAQGQIQSFTTELQAATTTNTVAQNIQSGLVGQLSDASNYYAIEQGKVAGVGIGGSEQIAGDILTWRAANLLPLTARVGDFILWSENQTLFSAAATRMAQAGQVVSYLSSTNNADLASAYAAAQTSFQQAQNENANAENALAQSQPADQVALLIQQSLTSLAAAYQDLSTVGTLVQGLAPQQ